MTSDVEPPVNDIWTVPGEEDLLPVWQEQDRLFAQKNDIMSYYHRLQIEDMLNAILENREPMVNGLEGRKSVELYTAIYRSQRDGVPVKFPLLAETDRDDYDGRLSYKTYSFRRTEI